MTRPASLVRSLLALQDQFISGFAEQKVKEFEVSMHSLTP